MNDGSSKTAKAHDNASSGKKAPTSKKNANPSPKKVKAAKAAPANPNKSKTRNISKVDPSKRTYGETFIDPGCYSDGECEFPSYKTFGSNCAGNCASDSDNGRPGCDYTHHRSDDEDDPEKREYEYGLRDDDEDDEYSSHYDGDDKYPRGRRY